MKNDTVVKVVLGQGVGRGVQEAAAYADTHKPLRQEIKNSKLARIGGGGLLTALAMATRDADSSLTLGVAGTRTLVDGLIDVALQQVKRSRAATPPPTPAVRLISPTPPRYRTTPSGVHGYVD